LLNPLSFYEDVSREHPELGLIESFPLLPVASMIDMHSLEYVPTDDQIIEWEQMTGTPFHPPITTSPETDKTDVTCPKCAALIFVPWLRSPVPRPSTSDAGSVHSSNNIASTRSNEGVPGPRAPEAESDNIQPSFVEMIGTGYAQNAFVEKCTNTNCGFEITRDALCVIKLLNDVAKMTVMEAAVLATTLIDPQSGILVPHKARDSSFTIARSFQIPNASSSAATTPVSEIGDRFNWNMNTVRRAIEAEFSGRSAMDMITQARLPACLAAYSVEQPYSVDLIASALRLTVFTSQIHALNWTSPGHFDLDPSPLERCIARYHQFLDIASKPVRKIWVPTRDIDLVWHTHMLKFTRYRKDMTAYLERVLNHEDKIEEGKISTGFDETATAWKTKFNTIYSSCTCLTSPSSTAPPDPPSISSSSGSSIKFWKKKKDPASFGDPSTQQNIPPSMPSLQPQYATVEHPSDHNSVIVCHVSKFKWLRGMREERFMRETMKLQGKSKGKEKEKGKGKTPSKSGTTSSNGGDSTSSANPNPIPESANFHRSDADRENDQDEHERAFARPYSEVGFSDSGPAGWALYIPRDPRVADEENTYKGSLVVGVEPVLTLASFNTHPAAKVFAARAAQGTSWATTV
jgi:hypothetical protein